MFILLFLTAPVASHAIARAAIADGVEPILDGPEIDVRDGDDLPPLGSTKKITTAIDASDAETSASVIVEDQTVGEKR